MGAYTGGFFGYREKAIINIRPPGVRPKGSISPMKLSPAMMEAVGVPAYDYSVRNGDVPKDYPESWIVIPWLSRMATWTLKGGPVEIQISYDGIAIGDTRVLRGSTQTLDAFRGFKIRQLIPGITTWYQMIAIV